MNEAQGNNMRVAVRPETGFGFAPLCCRSWLFFLLMLGCLVGTHLLPATPQTSPLSPAPPHEQGSSGTNRADLFDEHMTNGAWRTEIVVSNQSQVTAFFDVIAPEGPRRYFVGGSAATLPPPSKPPGFVWIPPSEFLMGSPESESQRLVDEGPLTVVVFQQGYYIAAREVTQAEYAAVIGEFPSFFSGEPQRPVDQVSWHQATNYCGLLTRQARKTGMLPERWAYRLPTEAEWEYAARAGQAARFWFGDDLFFSLSDRYGWTSHNSQQQTHRVGGKPANWFGLHDMNGNVREWCSDYYDTYQGRNVDDPRGPVSGRFRVVRGGSWLVPPRCCRSAQRAFHEPEHRDFTLGFRVVLGPIP